MIGFLKSKITQNDRVARGHPITHQYVTRNYFHLFAYIQCYKNTISIRQ